MRLFLASKYLGGLTSFLPAYPAELRTVFVPTAGSGYPTAPWIAKERDWFVRNGFSVGDLELATASPQQVAQTLKGADLVYVAGGNTYFLLQHMQRTDFWSVYRETAPLYAGVSAGAIVTCPDISYIDDLDEREQAPGLQDTTGAGLVDFRILPHVDSAKLQPKLNHILARWPASWPLEKLEDSEAIIVEGGSHRRIASLDEDLQTAETKG